MQSAASTSDLAAWCVTCRVESAADCPVGDVNECPLRQPLVVPEPVVRHTPTAERTRPPKGLSGPEWRLWLADRNLRRVLVGGGLLAAAAAVHFAGAAEWWTWPLLVASVLCTSRETAVAAVEALRGLELDIDVLMFVAAAGAAALGHPLEGAFLLFLFGLGDAGEDLATTQARRSLENLTSLAPQTAVRLDAAGERETVPAGELRSGDTVLVAAFDRLPADGVVSDGQSAVDQAPITGESAPVAKSVGDLVYAGTLNGGGPLTVRVTAEPQDTTLARIVRLVESARQSRAPVQATTDRVLRWYVPAVLLATAALGLGVPLAGGSWGVWFYRSMAFLTAASPCALAIGTPAAILCGIGRAAQLGVLVKGGIHLHALARVAVVAFDKTGTLTASTPAVSDILPAAGATADGLLALAAALECDASHPLAAAICREADRRGLVLPPVGDVSQQPGLGVRGTAAGRAVQVGNVSLLPRAAAPDVHDRLGELVAAGKTAVVVVADGAPLGLIGLTVPLREGADRVVAQLRAAGVGRVALITGDNRPAGEAVGRLVGVDEVHAEVLPADKLDVLRRLRRSHGPVAMVGDGVNDAPALAGADVGLAMGGAGSPAALETADVVLMGDSLPRVAHTIGLARLVRRIVGQNLLIALGVIAVLAPVAALGGASLGLAVLFHEGSTLVVVFNALRILRYRA